MESLLAKKSPHGTANIPLDASHINHDRGSGVYDNPRNGFYLTIYEHYLEHLKARPCPGQFFVAKHEKQFDNGLDHQGNRWAIELMFISILVFEHILVRQEIDFSFIEQMYEENGNGLLLPYDRVWEAIIQSCERFDGYYDLDEEFRAQIIQEVTAHKQSIGLSTEMAQFPNYKAAKNR